MMSDDDTMADVGYLDRFQLASIHEPISVHRYVDTRSLGLGIIGKFRQNREKGLYLDVTLKVNGLSIRAHKAYLAAFSDYFANLFGADMHESHQDEVLMKDIDGASLSCIIDYAYSGEIDITPDTVKSLLMTADYLLVEPLRAACCTYLRQRLDVVNVIFVLMLGDSLNIEFLTNAARQFAAEHVEQLTTQESFLEIPAEFLLNIFSSDDLVFTDDGFVTSAALQELKVLNAVLRYIGHDRKRVCLMPEFLSRVVRLPLLSRDLLSSLLHNELVVGSTESAAIIQKALDWLPDSENNLWSVPRKLSGLTTSSIGRPLATTAMLRVDDSSTFDDGTLAASEKCMYVTGMMIYIRQWDGRPVIGGLKIFYSTGDVVEHGRIVIDDNLAEFHLGEGERIISASARAGWLVDSLEFHTSHCRIIGPFGGQGGSSYNLAYPNESKSYLAYLKGHIDRTQGDTAVRHLELVWGFYKFTSQENLRTKQPQTVTTRITPVVKP